MMMTGKHLIAGEWIAEGPVFTNTPVSGAPDTFHEGTPALINRAVEAAEDAYTSYKNLSRDERAHFLRTIAEEIERRGDVITDIGSRETGLPEARLVGERGRTTGQLRLFADHIEAGDYLDRRFDKELPDRIPLPRSDLRMMQVPIGPVAVFGASNFPLAFSVAGGDTASALAAGCPVVVKGHEAHPGTSELAAQAMEAAIHASGMHPGVFSFVHGGSHEVGSALVQHPLIQAVGFTGSLRGGRALFDLCASRPAPIPFFGELGSVNPMFLLPHAVANRGKQIGSGWAASLTMGAGQFCTNPGVAVVMDGTDADAFIAATRVALESLDSQIMLTDGIADAYRRGRDHIAQSDGVESVLTKHCAQRSATPHLVKTTGQTWLANASLRHEVFGPLGMIVTVRDLNEMREIAQNLEGQLTCTLHLDDADMDTATALLPLFERKAGWLLANGFPTGVEVADSMIHGGPYPASTNFGATSVGTLSIRRLLRPVCYQNMPINCLPRDLRGA